MCPGVRVITRERSAMNRRSMSNLSASPRRHRSYLDPLQFACWGSFQRLEAFDQI